MYSGLDGGAILSSLSTWARRIREAGFALVREGTTTTAEVLRVTSV